ncbi:MAG: TRAP transporter TatT component family protein [Pseudomonadota bacterium]
MNRPRIYALGLLLALFLLCGLSSARAAGEDILAQADSLYAQRIKTEKAEAALALYRQAQALSPDSAPAALGLGRCLVWLAVVQENEKSSTLVKEAVDVLSGSLKKDPDNPGLHYWLGTAQGLQANEGPLTAVTVMGAMRKHLNRVIELEPGYEYGGAYRVLGRLDAKAPGLLGGDKVEAEELLKKAISLAPAYWHNHLFLADLYYKTDRKKEAEALLNKVLASRPQPGLEAEHQIWLKEAELLLARLQGRASVDRD